MEYDEGEREGVREGDREQCADKRSAALGVASRLVPLSVTILTQWWPLSVTQRVADLGSE